MNGQQRAKHDTLAAAVAAAPAAGSTTLSSVRSMSLRSRTTIATAPTQATGVSSQLNLRDLLSVGQCGCTKCGYKTDMDNAQAVYELGKNSTTEEKLRKAANAVIESGKPEDRENAQKILDELGEA